MDQIVPFSALKDVELRSKLLNMWRYLGVHPDAYFRMDGGAFTERVDKYDGYLRINRGTGTHGRGGDGLDEIPIYVWLVCNTFVTTTHPEKLATLINAKCAPYPYILPVGQMLFNEEKIWLGAKQWTFSANISNRIVNLDFKFIGMNHSGEECYLMSRVENGEKYLRIVKRVINDEDIMHTMLEEVKEQIYPQIHSMTNSLAKTILTTLDFDWISMVTAILQKQLPFVLEERTSNYFQQVSESQRVFSAISSNEAHSILSQFNIPFDLLFDMKK